MKPSSMLAALIFGGLLTGCGGGDAAESEKAEPEPSNAVSENTSATAGPAQTAKNVDDTGRKGGTSNANPTNARVDKDAKGKPEKDRDNDRDSDDR